MEPSTKPKTSATPYQDHSSTTLSFLSPGPKIYDTLMDQAEAYLDKYCTNWKDQRSYLMPPLFHCCKSFDLGEKEYEQLQQEKLMNNSQCDVSNVHGHKASISEHHVFRAIQELINDEIQNPFIAVHSWDLARIRNRIEEIFRRYKKDKWKDNSSEWKKWENEYEILNLKEKQKSGKNKTFLRERDFILIGPKIGIIFIEVKSSEQGSFSFLKGYEQLEGVNALISLIDLCAHGVMRKNYKYPDDFIRKVLVASEMTEAHYNDYIKTLKNENEINMIKEAGSVIHLFKEEPNAISTEESKKPKLYTNLRRILETSSCNSFTAPIFHQLYLEYAPVIACLKSVAIGKSATDVFEECDFSEPKMISLESSRLTNQKRPLPGQENDKQKGNDRVILFSPDQQNVLDGPYRQVIFGPPGTGKTVVLETKILDLLRKNETVTVLAPKSYAWRYKKLFDNRDFVEGKLTVIACQPKMYLSKWFDPKNLLKNYTFNPNTLLNDLSQIIFANPVLFLHSLFNLKHLANLIIEYQGNLRSNRTEDEKLEFIYHLVDQTITKKSCDDTLCHSLLQIFDLIFGSDNIIIDDGLEEFNAEFGKSQNYFFAITLIMALAKKGRPEKYVWLAGDPYGASVHSIRSSMHDAVITKLLGYQKQPNEIFAITTLTEVMRCCKTIFEAAYKNENMDWRQELEPSLGHWVQGCPIFTIERPYKTMNEALISILDEIKKHIETINRADGIDIENVGIVVTKFGDSETNPVLSFLRERCQSLATNIRIGPLGNTITEEQLLSEQRLKIDETNVLSIEDWDKVSSLEWPIVFYVSCLPISVNKRKEIAYQRYRSISRGIIKVIEFQFTYEDPI